jgi:Protein of unknown function (DUF3144)
MADDKQDIPFYELADQYINLANELAQSQGSANVGTALRYAAARYNCFEASMSTQDLPADADKMVEQLCADFREMLKVNMQDHIAIAAQEK